MVKEKTIEEEEYEDLDDSLDGDLELDEEIEDDDADW